MRLAPTPAEYRESLLFYASLFEKLATVAVGVETMTAVAKESGKLPRAAQGPVSLDDVEQLLSASEEFPQKARLRELADGVRRLDARQLTKAYWDRVYGIYDVIPHPVDPRAQGATSTLFHRFHCELAVAPVPTPLEQTLRATGQRAKGMVGGAQLSDPGRVAHGRPAGDPFHPARCCHRQCGSGGAARAGYAVNLVRLFLCATRDAVIGIMCDPRSRVFWMAFNSCRRRWGMLCGLSKALRKLCRATTSPSTHLTFAHLLPTAVSRPASAARAVYDHCMVRAGVMLLPSRTG